jgi:hypothetical protein
MFSVSLKNTLMVGAYGDFLGQFKIKFIPIFQKNSLDVA